MIDCGLQLSGEYQGLSVGDQAILAVSRSGETQDLLFNLYRPSHTLNCSMETIKGVEKHFKDCWFHLLRILQSLFSGIYCLI